MVLVRRAVNDAFGYILLLHVQFDGRVCLMPGSSNKCFLYYTANSGILGRGYTRQGDKHNMEFIGRTMNMF